MICMPLLTIVVAYQEVIILANVKIQLIKDGIILMMKLSEK